MKSARFAFVAPLIALLLLSGMPAPRAAAPETGDVAMGGGGGSGGSLGCGVPPAANPDLWRPWVGVYEDAAHTDECVEVPPYQFFSLYVWWRPGSRGMSSAEFKVDIPDDIYLLGLETNPVISAQSGDLESGISVAFSECQTDWVWTHLIYGMFTASYYGTITVDPFPGLEEPQLVACDSDHSTEWPFAFWLYYTECSM
jgi:hypothetical protein